ncbi:hypothetical protein ABPG74_019943 [Tetrahymena malaccensis]
MINLNDPFVIPDKYTKHYKPKQSNNDNLPFYHDIYSVAKTIEVLLNKLNEHKDVKNKLQKQIQELVKDDDNSIQIDCFFLPQKFINCLIDEIDPEIKEFLEIYLVQIEEYLTINKENNKVFYLESQFQYAEIVLNILKFQKFKEKIENDKIKLRALQTKIYALFKKQKYQEILLCIEEIMVNKLYELNPQEILIGLITVVSKVLIKIKKIVFSSELYENLIEFILKNEHCEWKNIGEKGVQFIVSDFEQNQNIMHLNLDLRSNNIEDELIQKIAIVVEKCQNINHLNFDLSDSNIGEQGALSIVRALEKCPNITQLELYLKGNQIGYEVALNIEIALRKCKNISQLELQLKNVDTNKKEENIIINKEDYNVYQNANYQMNKINWNHLYQKTAKNISNFIKSRQFKYKLYLGNLSEKINRFKAVNTLDIYYIQNQTMSLSDYKIEENQALNIASVLQKCQNINHLYLDLG